MKKRIALVVGLLGLSVAALTAVTSVAAAAAPGACTFTLNGAAKTMSLNADCTTSTAIHVASGYTLDGKGHTITAVDPASGAWDGAVVANDGNVMNVKNVEIDGASVSGADDCNRVFNGIALTNASGSITGVALPETGCQLGRAILVDDTASTAQQSVTIASNHVSNYNKNGIDVRGKVAATINGNTVTTSPSDLIVRNGMVIRTGASAQIWNNVVSGNQSAAFAGEASGILAYDNGTVSMTKGPNTLSGNDVPLNNDGGNLVGKWVSP